MVSISIVIPVYNAEKYLDRCFESILHQTLKDIEIICVDDGSTDGSAEILDKYAKADSRFVITHIENGGAGKARNSGIRLATGDYILFMDPDDWYPNNQVLELHLSKHQKSNCLVSGGSLSFFDSKTGRFDPTKAKGAIFSEEAILSFDKYQYDYFFQRFLYSSVLFKQYNVCFPDNRRYQDVIFLLNVMSNAKRFYCFPETTYVYYGNSHDSKFFSRDKVLDWMDGMRQALSITKVNGWAKIHCNTLLRLTYDNFKEASRPLRETFDSEYFCKLDDIFCTIDSKEIRNINPNIDDNYLLLTIKYGAFLSDLEDMAISERKQRISVLIDYMGFELFTDVLTYNYIGKYEQLNTIVEAIPFTKISQQISTIGIFTENMEFGGVQRCISELIPIFTREGYGVVLFSETDAREDCIKIPSNITRVVLPGRNQFDKSEWVLRNSVLRKAIKENKVDVMCYNAYWKNNLIFDLLVCKYCASIPFVIQHHNVFSAMLARNNDLFFRCISEYRLADCVIALSSVDQAYFRLMNIPSLYVNNPSEYCITSKHKTNEANIIWVGRFVPNHKQPIEALKIMAIVVRSIPSATLYMVGDGSDEVKSELYNYVRDYGLTNNVIFTGFSDRVDDYYSKARVMLLTSRIEGFPMVVAECKSYGVPLVAYDLPYVEMIRDSLGVIRVVPYDCNTAAKAICDVINDQGLYEQLSEDARKSLDRYDNNSVVKGWNDVFTYIDESDTTRLLQFDCNEEDLKVMLSTLIDHTQKRFKSPAAPQIYSPSTLVKKFVNCGFNGLISLVRKQYSESNMFIDASWKPLNKMKSIGVDFIVSGGIGARITHNIQKNGFNSKIHMPYDSFGNYSLHQLLDVLRGGTNDLFVDFSVFEDDGRYYHIEDNHTGIVSTKDVRISEDLENCLSRIRGREQGKFRDFVDKMSNGCKCAVILANRPDATLGINFAIELSKLYPKSTITVVNVRSDFSLGDKIVFRELYSKRRVRVLEVMFDDRSDVKWTGNEEKWAEFLSKFYHTR